MKIGRIKTGEWGKVKAFFDVTVGGLTIKGFRLVEGINGLFASMPSQQDKDGNYNDIVMATKDVRKSLNEIAIKYYDNQTQPTRQIGGVSGHYKDQDDRGDVGHLNAKRVQSFDQVKNVINDSEEIPF